MANLNKVLLMGNLTRDPELRYTPNGTPVCDFGLAVNRTFTTKDGEKRDETLFVDVTMWGKRGVAISEYLSKGNGIFVEGRLKLDTWETAEGKRSKITVVAENFQFVGGPGSSGRRAASGAGAAKGERPAPGPAKDKPASEPPEEPAGRGGMDVSDEEIPF